jgi:hypothetical protein
MDGIHLHELAREEQTGLPIFFIQIGVSSQNFLERPPAPGNSKTISTGERKFRIVGLPKHTSGLRVLRFKSCSFRFLISKRW